MRFVLFHLLLALLLVGCRESTNSTTPDDPTVPGDLQDPDPPGPVPQETIGCDQGFDFEDECDPVAFEDFGGGATSVIDNPDPSGINRTPRVVQMQKFDGEVFGGSSVPLSSPVDWSQGTSFTMRAWAARAVDVLFKLEGLEQERTVVHDGGSRWQETCFEFEGFTEGNDATGLTIIFDLVVVGKAATDPEKWTFYFDGIEQVESCPEPDPIAYELVFADEFDSGTMPSPDTWNMETGYGVDDSGWGNNEWQLYTTSPDNVRVEDGNLVITALCDGPCGVRDDSVTSARITTQDKFEFRYGRVEARIKPPVGRGAWPAFWALGANFPEIDWPRSGEIDFMEMHNAFSDERTTHFTIHYCDEEVQAPETCSSPDGHVFITRNLSLDQSLGDDFHIF